MPNNTPPEITFTAKEVLPMISFILNTYSAFKDEATLKEMEKIAKAGLPAESYLKLALFFARLPLALDHVASVSKEKLTEIEHPSTNSFSA